MEDVEAIVQKLKKVYPYWWKWELLKLDPHIASQVIKRLNDESRMNWQEKHI